MKRAIYKVKYYWHIMQFNKNRTLLEDCRNSELKRTIRSKMQYHERAAVNYIAKL